MIYLLIAIFCTVMGFYLGVIKEEKKYKKTIIELQTAQQQQNAAWGRHCKVLREQYFKVLTKKHKIPHENEICVYEEKEKYRNVTVVIGECKKCGRIDISWHRQENTEEAEVE